MRRPPAAAFSEAQRTWSVPRPGILSPSPAGSQGSDPVSGDRVSHVCVQRLLLDCKPCKTPGVSPSAKAAAIQQQIIKLTSGCLLQSSESLRGLMRCTGQPMAHGVHWGHRQQGPQAMCQTLPPPQMDFSRAAAGAGAGPCGQLCLLTQSRCRGQSGSVLRWAVGPATLPASASRAPSGWLPRDRKQGWLALRGQLCVCLQS